MSKLCSKCQLDKPLDEFYKQSSSKDGLQSWCKSCLRTWEKSYKKRPEVIEARRAMAREIYWRDPEKFRQKKRDWANSNPHNAIDHRHGRGAGVVYDRLIAEQDGKCAFCRRDDRKLHLDHSHQTGEFRWALCGNCNRALGLLGESPETIERMLNLLNEHLGDTA